MCRELLNVGKFLNRAIQTLILDVCCNLHSTLVDIGVLSEKNLTLNLKYMLIVLSLIPHIR
jgi:hypothetical protein